VCGLCFLSPFTGNRCFRPPLRSPRKASVASAQDSDPSVRERQAKAFGSPGTASARAGAASSGSLWPQYYVVVSGPLHLHSTPGVGGTIVAELVNGSIIKAIGMEASWMEVECAPGSAKGVTAFLSKSKASSRSIVRVADDEDAERQWREQGL
jgi:hypothetical protein